MKLKYAYGIAPGFKTTLDQTKYRSRIDTIEKDGVFVIFLEYFRKGAEDLLLDPYYLKNLAEFAVDRFDSLSLLTDEEAAKEIWFHGKKSMEHKAKDTIKVGSSLTMVDSQEYSLVLVAVKGSRFLAAHKGSGMIGLRSVHEDDHETRSELLIGPALSLISGSREGFPGSSSCPLSVKKGSLSGTDGMILMNKGASLSLYHTGEGRLSPACDTFLDWLAEYDSETVSEALEDNVEKYFIKETEGDISIVLLVPDSDQPDSEEVAIVSAEDEPAIGEETTIVAQDELATDEETTIVAQDEPESDEDISVIAHDEPVTDEEPLVFAEEPAIEKDVPASLQSELKSANSQVIKRLVAAAAVLMVSIVVILLSVLGLPGTKGSDQKLPNGAGSDITAEDNELPDASGEGESDQTVEELDLERINPAEYEPMISFTVSQPKAYEPGFYRVGKELPPGEYFFWTGEMLEPGSIEINGEQALSDELYCMTVQVSEGETLSSIYRFTDTANINPIKITNGILISGKYRIGKDIAPGEYDIYPVMGQAAGRYYSVLDGKISNNTEVEKRTTVKVPDEGYVVFYRSYIVAD